MCIIIYSPNGEFPKKHLSSALENNRDGWGIMWPGEDGKLSIMHGMTAREFFFQWKWLKKVKGPKVFHARIGTHGVKDTSNCHPFEIPQHANLGMVHNGIIKQQEKEGDASDTKNFVDNILQFLPEGFYKDTALCELIEDYIGFGKMVFMEGSGDTYILNELMGTWEGGRWYSNRSYVCFTGYTKPKGIGFVPDASLTFKETSRGLQSGSSNGGYPFSVPSAVLTPSQCDKLDEKGWVDYIGKTSNNTAEPLTGGDDLFMSAVKLKKHLSMLPLPEETNSDKELQDLSRIRRVVSDGKANNLAAWELHIFNKHGGGLTISEKLRVRYYLESLKQAESANYPCVLPDPATKYSPEPKLI